MTPGLARVGRGGRVAGDLPDVMLVVGGLNDDTAEEIDVALSRRKVGLIRADGDLLQLLGADDWGRSTRELHRVGQEGF